MVVTRKQPSARLPDGTQLMAKAAKELRQICRSFDPSKLIKMSSLGGDPSNSFEQSFASIAYTYLQDKAPVLLDYLVGFQLVERSDDNSRAVGVFGAKHGKQWLLMPVFFLNGDMKGHELLYLKDKDLFVPLKENWVNYIINRKPSVLGEGVPETQQQLGIQAPDMESMRHTPSHSKFGSFSPPVKQWSKEAGVFPHIAKWATENPSQRYQGLNEALDFGKFIGTDLRFAKAAAEWQKTCPVMHNAFATFYDVTSTIKSALLRLRDECTNAPSPIFSYRKAAQSNKKICNGSVLKQAVADTFKKVEVITEQVVTENLPTMNESEKEKLLRDGYLIRDHRSGDEVSSVYNTQIPMTLVNPDETGIFDVLLKPGVFGRCLVIVNPLGGSSRVGTALVDLDSGKRHVNTDLRRIFIKQDDQAASTAESEFQKWLSGQSDSESPQVDARYVLLTQKGTGTYPFEVRADVGDGVYEVRFDDYIPYGYSSDRPVVVESTESRFVVFGSRPGSEFRRVGGHLYVPDTAKLVKIRDVPTCAKCRKTREECDCSYFRDSEYDAPRLSPGDMADVQLQLINKQASGELHELKIWSDGNEAVINNTRMSKMAALLDLVVKHGMREKIAKKLIKSSERSAKRWLVKYAAPGLLGPYDAVEGPMSSPFPADPNLSIDPSFGNVPMQYADDGQYVNVPGMQDADARQIYDPMQGLDPQTMQVAQQAAQSGQKEIFDVSAVSGMLKTVRQESMVDKFLPDLIKALDRLGRMLLFFYWHNKSFAERYGKKDLPELEDSLRNSFEDVGDLVLFLKQKTVDTLDITGQFGSPDINSSAE